MSKVLGYDCDGKEIYEYRILRAIWSNDIDIEELPDSDPRQYCALIAEDGNAYAISVYDWWNKDLIIERENRKPDSEIPIIIKPISEMVNYECAVDSNGNEFYYDLDKDKIKKKLNTLLEKDNELDQVRDIAESLGLKFALHDLKKQKKENVNAFDISSNLVFFYPLNDGEPTCTFSFYENEKLVLDNRSEYSQISNLDEIIRQMVKLYNQALDSRIVLDPYYFMLELSNRVAPNYRGRAKLVATEKAIMNPKLSTFNFDRANTYFINQFLDHFIGWNFGLSVNRNEKLKEELNKLNEKVIKMKLRESAGLGFEVFGTDTEAINGIQHYYLPTELPDIKKKTKE
jgi:hypothetical protein